MSNIDTPCPHILVRVPSIQRDAFMEKMRGTGPAFMRLTGKPKVGGHAFFLIGHEVIGHAQIADRIDSGRTPDREALMIHKGQCAVMWFKRGAVIYTDPVQSRWPRLTRGWRGLEWLEVMAIMHDSRLDPTEAALLEEAIKLHGQLQG